MAGGAAGSGGKKNAGEDPLARRTQKIRHAAGQPFQRDVEEIERRAMGKKLRRVADVHWHHAVGHMFAGDPGLGAPFGQAGETGDIKRSDLITDPVEGGAIHIKR